MPFSHKARRLFKTESTQGRALTKVYLRGDRLMTYLLLGHVLLGLGLAGVYGTWAVSLPAILLAASLFFGTERLFPAQLVTRIMAGISLQMFVMLHIYQMHGLAEMHFFFFTSTTAMIAYQDERAILPGVLLLIGQHLAFALLHNQGWRVFFFEQSEVGWVKLFFHFGVAFAQALLCNVFAAGLRKRTIADAVTHENLLSINMEIRESQAKLSKESARKSEELAAARELQQSIMPDNSLQIPGWRLQAQMHTCVEVGGDYFDYKVISEGHVLVAVGDATGHGMKAAIVVAAAKGVFQRLAGHFPPNMVFREMSHALQALGIRGTYMGLILLELKEGRARIIASGMPPVMLKRAASGKVERLTQPGPYLGFMAATIAYPEAEVALEEGDVLLAFSDGLSERFDAEGKILGWEAVGNTLTKLNGQHLAADIDTLLQKSMDWQQGLDLPDDVTVMLAQAVPVTTNREGSPAVMPAGHSSGIDTLAEGKSA